VTPGRVPESLDDLTPDWLTLALSKAGVLPRGRVTATRPERVGQQYGFTGVVARVEVDYEDEEGRPPRSLIAKLPMAQDAVSAYRKRQERDPALLDRYYDRSAREVRFYRSVPVAFAPRLYYGEADDARRRVVLLLEDLTGGRQGDALDGCSVDDAARVIEEVAPFHARWWGEHAPVAEFPPAVTDDPRTRQERFSAHLSPFFAAHGDHLSSDLAATVEALGSRLGAVACALEAGPQALIHGDLHLDNMIFSAGGGRSVVVLDWQTVGVGPPAWDVALFLVGSLSAEDRRAVEAELFDRYVGILSAHGIRDYSAEDLRRQFAPALLVMLSGTVVWLAALDRDELTARERELQQRALGDGRLGAALLDHDAAALLTS
jgi:thiamine kinase-like enzyme